MRASRTLRPPAGFTLVELLVTLSVMAIALALAVPSFESVLNGNRLATSANEVVASLQAARMEAVRRNGRVGVCLTPDPDAAVPACDAAGATGTVVYADADADGAIDAVADVIRRATIEAPVQLSSSPAAGGNVVFRSDGMAWANSGALLAGTIRVCVPTDSPAENVRDVSIASGSRVSITAANGGGACAAPANP